MPVTVTALPDDLIEGKHLQNKFYIKRAFTKSRGIASSRVRYAGPKDERWHAEITFTELEEDDWNRIEAFFYKIDGAGGFFSMWDAAKELPRGEQVNDVVTDAAYLTGTVETAATTGAQSVHIGGLKTSTTGVLKANDHISIQHTPTGFWMNYAVMDDVNSDGSGEATVTIRPGLFAPIAAADVVDFYRCRGVFQLAGDAMDGIGTRKPASLASIKFKAMGAPEVINL